MIPCKSTAEEVSFKWSHHSILPTDSKVRTTLHVSTIGSGRERVKLILCSSFFFPESLGSDTERKMYPSSALPSQDFAHLACSWEENDCHKERTRVSSSMEILMCIEISVKPDWKLGGEGGGGGGGIEFGGTPIKK